MIKRYEQKYQQGVFDCSRAVFGENNIKHIDAQNCFVYVENDVVAGFVMIEYNVNFDNIPNFKTEIENGYISFIAVLPSHQGKGIGHKLFSIAHHVLVSSVKTVYVLAWERYNVIMLKPLLDAYNYRNTHYIFEYWKKESEQSDATCIVCGETCYCNAALYVYHV